MAYLDFERFESRMEDYKNSYFNSDWTPRDRWSSSETYDSLVRSIIHLLYDYGSRIESFESSYGRNSDEYYRKYIERNTKPFQTTKNIDTSKEKIRKLDAEWDKENDRYGYSALLTIPSFIRKVEEIVDYIKNNNDKKLVVSDALDVLSSRSSGLPEIDSYNKRLAAAVNKSIEKEKEALSREISANVEKNIDSLKKTHFYKWKTRHGASVWTSRPGNMLATPENQPIRDNSGMTFKDIFRNLRNLSRHLTMGETKHYDNKTDGSLEKTFNERISGLKKDLEKISQLKSEMEKEMSFYEIYLNHEENYEGKNILSQVGVKILELKDKYANIVAKQQKYEKVILYIEAIKKRERAIDEAISVLRGNPGNAFSETIAMLQNEKIKCIELIKKREDILQLFEEFFNSFSKEISQVESLISRYNGIILEGKKRKEQEETQLLKDKEKAEKLARAREIEKLQPEIDKIKMEVIRIMNLEGYRPFSFDKGDYEHFREDYTAFNEVFIQRLKSELAKRGINFEGADLSNPYDAEFYQRIKEQDAPKISVETKENQEPVLKSVGYGTYMITSDYYRYVFDLMKSKLDQAGRDYEYDDVEELVEEYIDQQYGIDQIVNRDELISIMQQHRRETRKKRSGK